MKNKNRLAGILLAIATMTVFSCKDYLDLSPISSYNTGSFYQTEEDFELAVNGIYDILQSLVNTTALTLEGRSDNVQDDVINSYDNNLVHRFIDDESVSYLTTIWSYYWKMIDRSNAIIGQIDAVKFDDEEYKSYYKGEAYFFRGYAYFQLGWMYGGVPLIDHQMKVDEIKTTARSSQVETFSFAASDLTQAAQLLPEVWAAKKLGKATKYAAQGILARMYLFQKNYTGAKPLLLSIINSGKYQLAASYANCFLDTYDNSPEHVFQVQFTSGSLGEGNSFVAYEVPEFIRSSLFPTGGTSGANMVSYDLYNSYESGDLRRDFSIQKGYKNSSGVTDEVTLYYIKYAHGTIPTTKTDYGVNMPILRYTDVRLMYAEVLNEESYAATGEAFNIINGIRNRAGLSPLTSSHASSQEAFRDAILRERRVEFACEYLRWFDLLRTGKAMSVMNTFLSRSEEGSGKYKMEEYRSIFAIPQYELNVNPNTEYMWQNPGY
ncbi:MAG: RagB/SusD family nutrient uptake outer membrane protein [Mangrovibacterium sp.]